MRALLVAVPLLFAGCCCLFSRPRFELPPYEYCSFTDPAKVDSRTAVREERLQMTRAMGPLYVALDACVQSGEGVWQVKGPNGATRWQCRVGAGRLRQNCRFDCEPGTWTVRREWRDFAGTQRFSVGAASFTVHLAEWYAYQAGLNCAVRGLCLPSGAFLLAAIWQPR